MYEFMKSKEPYALYRVSLAEGGSGKTTLAVHIAVAAEASGERVVLIDTDPQASASAWSQARTQESPLVEKATASSIARLMQRAEQNRATLAVIDTAPHADARRRYHCRPRRNCRFAARIVM